MRGIDEAVGFLEAMRTRATFRPFRREPVLVVPGEVSREQVESYVRQWCPDAVRRADTVLETPDGFDLLGPFQRAGGPVWPDVALPAQYQAAYVTDLRWTPGAAVSAETRYHLLDGLARRLSGRVRERFDKPWRDPAAEPAGAVVLAGSPLPRQDVLRLLAGHYPGLALGDLDDDRYELRTDVCVLSADLTSPSIFPLARLQSSSSGKVYATEYSFQHGSAGHGSGEQDLRRMADAAQTLAGATGGLVLDADGFPWHSRSGPA